MSGIILLKFTQRWCVRNRDAQRRLQ